MGTVVIADDDPDIRAMITQKLSQAGHEVTATEDGAAALAAVKRSRPDVVVLDMQMPGLSGLDVVRMIRADPTTATVPVIMVTSHSEPQFIGESFNSGADDFLAKPFRPRELAARIAQLMQGGPHVADEEFIGATAGGTTGSHHAGAAGPAGPMGEAAERPGAAETVMAVLVATDEVESKVGRRRFFRLLASSN